MTITNLQVSLRAFFQARAERGFQNAREGGLAGRVAPCARALLRGGGSGRSAAATIRDAGVLRRAAAVGGGSRSSVSAESGPLRGYRRPFRRADGAYPPGPARLARIKRAIRLDGWESMNDKTRLARNERTVRTDTLARCGVRLNSE